MTRKKEKYLPYDTEIMFYISYEKNYPNMTCLWEELALSVCNIDVIGKNFIILISFTIKIIINFMYSSISSKPLQLYVSRGK